MSYAGRLQIIQSVLFSPHSLWGSVFILLKSVLNEEDKLCRGFLQSTEKKKKISLAAWEKMSGPKSQEGLTLKVAEYGA